MKPVIYMLSAFLTYSLTYSLAHGQAKNPTPVAQGPLTFQIWKQQQINEAQTHVQKLSATPNDEKNLVRAREALAMTSELTLEEYISVYLPSLQDDRQAMTKLLEKLSKDEMIDILNALLKRSFAARKGADNLLGSNGSVLGR